MRLIASLTSPFARKVRVALAEKRVDYELVIDPPWNADTQVPTHNPLGKVPVLVLDDGSSLYDSRVIMEYIDTLSPVGKLYPETLRDRIAVKRWEALADGIVDAAVLIIMEQRRPAAQQSAEWVARQRLKIQRGLEAVAQQLGENPWCAFNSFGVADIAVGSMLGYLAFRFPDIDWAHDWPNLGRLYTQLLQRPSFAETVLHD